MQNTKTLKSRQIISISASFWIAFLVGLSWLSTRSKPLFTNPITSELPQNTLISLELASLPNRLGFLWTSTCDNMLRKCTWPSKSNYRHGLQFSIKSNTLHLFLCILLAGDIATNPGPACKNENFLIKWATINARSLKSFHKNDTTNSIVCNLERFQDFVYAENLDVVCVNETWLNDYVSNAEILHSDYTIIRKKRVGRNGGGVIVGIKTSSFHSVKEFSLKLDDRDGRLRDCFSNRNNCFKQKCQQNTRSYGHKCSGTRNCV